MDGWTDGTEARAQVLAAPGAHRASFEVKRTLMATTTTAIAGGGAVAPLSAAPRDGAKVAAASRGSPPAVMYHPTAMVAPGVVPYMAPRAPTPAAEVVGNSFVNQFYTILHSSPALLYRFYTNESTLIVSGEHGAAGDAPTTYRTQRDIHNKVVSMRYDEAQADVKSIDASHTLGGGVLVQVTGALRRKGENFARNFVQSFVLAPQENGFFVLNDIVRYLDKIEVAGEKSSEPQASAKEAKAAATKVETKVAKEGGKAAAKAADDAKPKVTEETKREEVADVDPNKPRTYAMMAATAAQVAAKAATVAKPAAAAPAAVAPAAATKPAVAEKTEQAASATKLGCGIFIKNIFISTTVEDLEREFSKFGVVVGGAKGINLKSPKLSHETKFAFIDFEEPSSAQAALEASVELHGKVLVVEMKKASSVHATGVSANGKRESKGRNGEGGNERKNGAKNTRQPKKTEAAASEK